MLLDIYPENSPSQHQRRGQVQRLWQTQCALQQMKFVPCMHVRRKMYASFIHAKTDS